MTDPRTSGARKQVPVLLSDEERAELEQALRVENMQRLEQGEKPFGLGTFLRDAGLEKARASRAVAAAAATPKRRRK